MNCLLSIIIPVYNVEKYVCKCLDSIFTQSVSLEQYEVIIVNDGSPDKSAELVRPYVDKYPNCTLINQKNGGLSVARNTGMDSARGDYIWFVDSDDWLQEDSISVVLSKIRANLDVDVFASTMMFYYEVDGHTLPESKLKQGIVSGSEYFAKGYPLGAAQRSIYKLNFLKSNNLRFMPNLLHEDGLWGYTVYYLANKILLLDQYIYMYQKRSGGSIMSSINIKSPLDIIKIHKLLTEFMQTKVAEIDRVWYERRLLSLLWAVYTFTRNIWDTPEYKQFLKDNRPYIRNACYSCMHIKGGWKLALAMLICPQLFVRMKH